MKYPVHIREEVRSAVVIAVAMVVAVALLESACSRGEATNAKAAPRTNSTADPIVDLSPSQLNSIKIEPVGTYQFPVEKEAVGNINYDEDLSVQVFPAYQGTIIKTFVELGARVQKDQPLYTIKSPDLIQAESTLIGAAATFELTNKELARVQGLPRSCRARKGAGDLRSTDCGRRAQSRARCRPRLWQDRRRNRSNDRLAQDRSRPGRAQSHCRQNHLVERASRDCWCSRETCRRLTRWPNVSIKWMLANVIESDIPLFHLGQPVQVKVMAYPNRVFKGKVSKIYETVDPNTHRVTIRSEIEDPKDELRPGMLANFVIRVHDPVEATAIPANGVVREPDGTMTAWVTTDRHHFVQRIIKTGLRKDDQVQILDGLQRGELAVTDGAVFLSNMLEAPPSD